MIEVILLERIERLGHMGQVVKVRPGYARNFLLPHKKALRATKANLDLFEKQKHELEAKNHAARGQAETLASKMDSLKLIVIRQASETGQLYGSVAARDVADAAKEAGHTIERMQVQIDTPIKALGLYPVKVKLHPEVTVKVTINVARSPEEAVVQAEKGVALIKAAALAAANDAEVAALEKIGQDTRAAKGLEKSNEAGDDAEPKTAKKKAKSTKAEPTTGDKGDEPKAKKPRAKKAS